MTALQFGYIECLPQRIVATANFSMLISDPCFPKGPASSMMRLLRILRKALRTARLRPMIRQSIIIARYARPARIA